MELLHHFQEAYSGRDPAQDREFTLESCVVVADLWTMLLCSWPHFTLVCSRDPSKVVCGILECEHLKLGDYFLAFHSCSSSPQGVRKR